MNINLYKHIKYNFYENNNTKDEGGIEVIVEQSFIHC